MAARVDSASRSIHASPARIYRALVDPAAMAVWRPPANMRGEILAFEPHPGGRFALRLTYLDRADARHGKTAAGEDLVEGRFAELVPDQRIVEVVEFVSDDPAFAGEMTITTTLTPEAGGTRVTIACTDVPPGIDAKDHEDGMTSTLANLARFVEG